MKTVSYTHLDVYKRQMQQTQLTLADGSLVTAYQETQEEGSEVESEFYTFYGVNSDAVSYTHLINLGLHNKCPKNWTHHVRY